jgi:putative ABC transport system permease protein
MPLRLHETRNLRLRESFRFAVDSIVAKKTRSALTILGIAIGVAAVVTLVAVGTGSQQSVDASIDQLGGNTLIVLPGGSGGTATATHRTELTHSDVQALADGSVPDASGVAPGQVVNNVMAQWRQSSATIGLVIGTTPEFLDIDHDTLAAGQDFTDFAYTMHYRQCVLGSAVAAGLSPRDPTALLGQDIPLAAEPFRITGILASKGYADQHSIDDRAICTGTAVEDYLHGFIHPGMGPVDAIAVAPNSPASLPAAKQEITAVLDARHHVPDGRSDFSIARASAVGAVGSAANGTLAVLLGSVAGISLLVGGIGVMNIMLISVEERTKEIGIRKAVGADPTDIIGQFIGEALMLTILGGSLGVLLGFVTSRFRIDGVEPSIAPYSVYLAFGMALGTGLVFGLYPAAKAARLQPVEAMRTEVG